MRILLILLLLMSPCYAQEIITGEFTKDEEGKDTKEISLTEESLSVLNEELRKNDTDIRDNTTDIATNTPTGIIVLWSGAVSAIPLGWVLCDGDNGTPNLTDRFVIHADNDSGGTRDVGDTGGSQTHTLTEAEMPAHTHTYTSATGSGIASIQGESQGSSVNTGSTGSGDAHNNMPKYYALAYIMKI